MVRLLPFVNNEKFSFFTKAVLWPRCAYLGINRKIGFTRLTDAQVKNKTKQSMHVLAYRTLLDIIIADHWTIDLAGYLVWQLHLQAKVVHCHFRGDQKDLVPVRFIPVVILLFACE